MPTHDLGDRKLSLSPAVVDRLYACRHNTLTLATESSLNRFLVGFLTAYVTASPVEGVVHPNLWNLLSTISCRRVDPISWYTFYFRVPDAAHGLRDGEPGGVRGAPQPLEPDGDMGPLGHRAGWQVGSRVNKGKSAIEQRYIRIFRKITPGDLILVTNSVNRMMEPNLLAANANSSRWRDDIRKKVKWIAWNQNWIFLFWHIFCA